MISLFKARKKLLSPLFSSSIRRSLSSSLSSSGDVVSDELRGYTVIGGNNIIGHHAVVGVKCQDLKYKVWVCVRDDNLSPLSIVMTVARFLSFTDLRA